MCSVLSSKNTEYQEILPLFCEKWNEQPKSLQAALLYTKNSPNSNAPAAYTTITHSTHTPTRMHTPTRTHTTQQAHSTHTPTRTYIHIRRHPLKLWIVSTKLTRTYHLSAHHRDRTVYHSQTNTCCDAEVHSFNHKLSTLLYFWAIILHIFNFYRSRIARTR